MASPVPTDYFDVEGLLAEGDRALAQRVRRFVVDRVMPAIPAAFDEGRFPAELVPGLGELGLLGCNLEGYGCPGMSNVAYGIGCRELERGDSAIRSFVSVQTSLAMYSIRAYGSEEQKERWLPALARGAAVGCFGLSEEHGGSDPGAMRTRAERRGGDWVLDGSKMWITNGSIADVAVVYAATDDGIRGFLIEKGTPGFETPVLGGKYSLRASATASLHLAGVRVPEEQRLPGAEGLGAPLGCLTQARYGIVWGAIGAAIDCFETARDFAAGRELFGRPLSHTQTVQRRLANMVRRITTAQLLALRLGQLKDEGRLHHSQVSLAKWNNVRMAIDIARDARDLLGASGIYVERSPIRHMLNLESVITYEGTETVHELVVGRELTGKTAF
jgi:glutaryl-CoA dehydrogenase